MKGNENMIIEYSSEYYPDKLRELEKPPTRLYAEGNIEILKDFGIAVIGSRTNTQYGEDVRELGRQNLQVGRRAPVLADAERPGLPEVEAVRRDIVLCPQPGFRNVLPGEAERLPVAGVHLAVEQGQPRLPVHRDRGNAQPFEVACHIGLHPFQAGAGLRDPLGGQAERDVF